MAMASGRPPGRPRRWTAERVERELRAIHAGKTEFLSRNALKQMGRHDLVSAMERTGGLDHWARYLGLPRHAAFHPEPYSWSQAQDDAHAAIERFGLLPGSDRLRGAGLGRLASFIQYRCGGRRRFLAELGFSPGDVDRLTGQVGTRRVHRWTPEVIERELRELFGDRADWPADNVFLRAGRADLLEAVRSHGGKNHWALVLGVRPRPPRPRRPR